MWLNQNEQWVEYEEMRSEGQWQGSYHTVQKNSTFSIAKTYQNMFY